MIPSKGRANACTTADALRAEGLACEIAVGPEDADEYAKSGHTLFVLPEPNRGIGYSRWNIMNEMRRRGEPWFWMIDDDVKRLGIVKNRHIHDLTWRDGFSACESYRALSPKIAEIGLMHRTYAWAAKEPYKLNRCPAEVVLVRTDTGVNYRPDIRLYADGVFFVETLRAGYHTIKLQHFCFTDMPRRAAGGCSDIYANEEEVAMRTAIVAAITEPYMTMRETGAGQYELRGNNKLIDRDFGRGGR